MNKSYLEQIITSCEAILLEIDPSINRLHARAIKHIAQEMLEEVIEEEADGLSQLESIAQPTSNCCDAAIKGGLCADCLEHCEPQEAL